MASFEFRCPGCQQRLVAEGGHLRIKVLCQRCGYEQRPIDAIDPNVPIPALPVDETSGAVGSAAASPPGAGLAAQHAPWVVEPKVGWKSTRQGTVLLVPSDEAPADPAPRPRRAPWLRCWRHPRPRQPQPRRPDSGHCRRSRPCSTR